MRIIYLIFFITILAFKAHAQENGIFSDLKTAFQNPLEVKELNVSHVSSEDLQDIGKFKNIETLRISFCKGIEIPKTIGDLKFLKDLQLGSNGLTVVPEEIGNLTNLERLFLDRNRLTELPKEIGKLKKLHYLDLAGNDLKSFPNEIANLERLTHLDLSANYNFNFVQGFELISDLPIRSLDLSATSQNHLPKSIAELETLESIVLMYNDHAMDFEFVFNQLSTLPGLKKLDISRNPELRTIPESITKLKNLEELSLHADYNIELNKEIEKLSGLSRLKIIDLGSLGLEALPPNFYFLKNLQEISLWGNDKLNFQNAFYDLSKLKHLNKLALCECNLTKLPQSISGLKVLTELDLGENPTLAIESIQPAVKDLKNLKTINLTCMFSNCNFDSNKLEKIRSQLDWIEIVYENWGW